MFTAAVTGLPGSDELIRLNRMKVRLRSVAALLALLAFSLFWVEGVWASMCSPAMEAGGPAPVAVEAGRALDASAMDMPQPADSNGSRSDAPHCPLAVAGAASCAASAPLAARVATPEVPSLEGASLPGSPDHAKDLLLAVALFHPPRA